MEGAKQLDKEKELSKIKFMKLSQKQFPKSTFYGDIETFLVFKRVSHSIKTFDHSVSSPPVLKKWLAKQLSNQNFKKKATQKTPYTDVRQDLTQRKNDLLVDWLVSSQVSDSVQFKSQNCNFLKLTGNSFYL